MLSTEDIRRYVEHARRQLDRDRVQLLDGNNDLPLELAEQAAEATVETQAHSSAEDDGAKRQRRVVRRSVSASPSRRGRYVKDYSQELQIQIYPSDIEDEDLLSRDGTGAGLLETVSKVSGNDGGPEVSGSLSARTTADDIRKYYTSKLGGMLRAGEFSPNHPEMGLGGAVPRCRGDVFVGLGLYEEKRRELMVRRKKEYREYLAKQKNLDAIARQKQKLSMERYNNLYDNRYSNNNNADPSPGYPDDGGQYPGTNRQHLQSFLSPAGGWKGEDMRAVAKPRRPSSIAVQTEDDLLLLDRVRSNNYLMQAERELSPRPTYNTKSSSQALQQVPNNNSNVGSSNAQNKGAGQNNPDWRMLVEKVNIGTQNNLIMPTGQREVPGKFLSPNSNYDDGREYFEAINDMDSKVLFGKDSPRARLLQDLRHTYMPSLFDEDAIRQRNVDCEKEVVAKRMSYQQELKQQIDDQHRLREERKTREKLLEEAETRRLEEQLKLLKLAHEAEMEKQKQMAIRIKKDSSELERQRRRLQHEIDYEKKALRHAKFKQNNSVVDNEVMLRTSRSDPVTVCNQIKDNNNAIDRKNSNLPFYYSAPPLDESPDAIDSEIMSYNLRRNNPYLGQDPPPKRIPYSTNIPNVSNFNQSIPVKNYNSNENADYSNVEMCTIQNNQEMPKKFINNRQNETKFVNTNSSTTSNWSSRNQKANYEPSFLNKSITEMIDTKNLIKNTNRSNTNYDDSLPIPVLREPPESNAKLNNDVSDDGNVKYSEAMKHVDDKWKVPAVQKNILKTNTTEDGKQESILTQLGSIRRQLQLEQLKLDQSQMLPKRLIK